MAQIDIQCRQCEKVFQADNTLTQVFCVYCGARNQVTDPAGSAGPARMTWIDEATETAVRAAFDRARFRILDRKTGQKADHFVGFWTSLLFHSNTNRSNWGLRSARKEIERFFERRELQEALALAGENGLRLLCEQLVDSGEVFLQTCRDDRRYGSKLLDMIRLKPEDVANKAAFDICYHVLSFLVHLDRPAQSDLVIFAAVMAYPRVFPDYKEQLGLEMAKLPDEERKIIMEIVRDVGSRFGL